MASIAGTDVFLCGVFMMFCVDFPVKKVIWLLVARSEAVMDKWMAAINAQIHENFVNKYNIPADNYRSQG